MNQERIFLNIFFILSGLFFSWCLFAMEEVVSIESKDSNNIFNKKLFNGISCSQPVDFRDFSFYFQACADSLFEDNNEQEGGFFTSCDAPIFQSVDYSDRFERAVILKRFALQHRRFELEEKKTELRLTVELRKKNKFEQELEKLKKREQEILFRQQEEQSRIQQKLFTIKQDQEKKEQEQKVWAVKNKKMLERGVFDFSAYLGIGCLFAYLLKSTMVGKNIKKLVAPIKLGSYIKSVFVPVGVVYFFGRFCVRKTKEIFSNEFVSPLVKDLSGPIQENIGQAAEKIKTTVKDVLKNVETFSSDLIAQQLPLVTQEVNLIRDETLFNADVFLKQQLISVEGGVNGMVDNILCNKIPLATTKCNEAIADVLCQENIDLLDFFMKKAGGSARDHLIPVAKELSAQATGEAIPGLAKGAVSIPGRLLCWALGWDDKSNQSARDRMEKAVISGRYSNKN